MKNIRQIKTWILDIYPYYHKFTLFCVVLFFSYKAMTFEVPTEHNSITWVIEVLTPDFWEQFEGTTPLAPIDFIR